FFSPLPIYLTETLLRLLTLVNYLIYKEFSVSSAPEEVRIIDTSTGTSRVYLSFCYNRGF
ncbi:MAG: hypothetical protein ACOH2R_08305, partial [Pseudomonas sp.]